MLSAAMRPLRVLDLFAGAGGFSTGFAADSGYEIVAAVERDDTAGRTFQVNHPGIPALLADIRSLGGEDILDLADGPVDVLVAGPPCQGFSMKGQRNPSHESTALLMECARLIAELEPSSFIIENVPGLLSFRRGFVIDSFFRKLNALRVEGVSYGVTLETLDAAGFGVPQHRKRIFIAGILGECLTFPDPSPSRIPLVDAIGDLPEWTTRPNEVVPMPKGHPLTQYQLARRRGAAGLYNHSAKRLQELRLARLAHLRQGEDRRSLPNHLQAGGHEGKYRRLRSSRPSPTLVAHMAKDTSDFIHPYYERMLTVREAARIQSFDDRYRFVGSQYQQFRQIGNSVPPLLAHALAKTLELPARRAARRLQLGGNIASSRRAATI
jgi:DNA (cytosine-5)-methyltransferase 1